jgi:Cdc25 family phosphatase
MYIEPKVLKETLNIDKIRVVDVRDDDFVDFKVKDSINIPSEVFDKSMRDLYTDLKESGSKKVVFHCHYSAQRGPRCANKFSQFLEQNGAIGEVEVLVLKGGIAEWVNLILYL